MAQAKTVKCKASYCAHRVQLKAEKNSVAFSPSSAELPSLLTGFSNPFWHLRHLNSWWEEVKLWRSESHFRFTVQSLTKPANSLYGMYCENSLFNMSLKKKKIYWCTTVAWLWIIKEWVTQYVGSLGWQWDRPAYVLKMSFVCSTQAQHLYRQQTALVQLLFCVFFYLLYMHKSMYSCTW